MNRFIAKVNNRLYNSYLGLKQSVVATYKIDDDGNAKNRRRILEGNFLAGIATNMTAGVFFTGLVLIILADETEKVRNGYLGNITILQLFCGLAQLFSPLILEKLERRRGYVIAMRILYHFSNIIFLGVIPLLPFSATVKINLLMVGVVLMYTSQALAAPGLSVWQLGSLPDQHRANHFALQSMACTAVNALSAFLCSLFMDLFKSGGRELTAILILRGLAILVATWETWSFFDVSEPVYTQPDGNKMSFGSILTVPFRHPAFLLMVFIAGLWSFAANIPGQYYNAFMLTDAKMSYTYLNIASMCSVPFSILMTPVWNKIIHRYGWLKPMAISVALYAGAYVINVAVTEHTQFAYIISAVYCNSVAPGVTLGFANLPYLKIPEEGRSSCIAFYSSVSSLAGLGGSVLARQFMQWTDGSYLNLFGWQIKNGSYINLLSAAMDLLIAGFILLVYLRDKREEAARQQKELSESAQRESARV